MKIKLAGVAETLLIPLWARAWKTTKPGEHLVEDPMAVELVRKIEALHPQLHFQEQWTLYEHHRRCWGIMGALSLIPWWNKNCNDKVIKLVIGS